MFTEYLNTLSEYSPLSDVTKSQLEPYISVKNLNKDDIRLILFSDDIKYLENNYPDKFIWCRIFFVFGAIRHMALQNQVGKNSLLLLPPGFSVMPSIPVEFFVFTQDSLYNIVPSKALVIVANIRH